MGKFVFLIFLSFCSSVFAQQKVVVVLEKGDFLSEKVGNSDKYKIRKLVIKGYLSHASIAWIRGNLHDLKALDISRCVVEQDMIPHKAFYHNYHYSFYIEELKLPDGLKFIGNQAFANCSIKGKLRIPDSVEAIGMFAFARCKDVSGIVFPKGCRLIGFGAFHGMIGLSGKVVLPDSLKHVAMDPFDLDGYADQRGLRDDLKLGVRNPFSNCPNIERFEICLTNRHYKTIDGILYRRDEIKALCAFPAARKGRYSVIDGTSVIGESAFQQQS